MKTIYIIQFFTLWISACSYLPDKRQDNPDLTIRETANYIELNAKEGTNTALSGIVFYPGGLVDPHAYIEILAPLATQSKRKVIIVKVEANLAVLNTQKASKVIKDFADIKRWVLGGHSLGGAMACVNVFKNYTDFSGLFLLAAYSDQNLSQTEKPVISITASNDKVLDWNVYNANKFFLPPELPITTPLEIPNTGSVGNTLYYTIKGGVHYQFGSYGIQNGDGTPTISSQEQHQRVFEALNAFLINNQL